jgi:sugar fermentation stimulation protein A
MIFTPPLRCATLIKRYKRFLADVITPKRKTMTLHCANTGAMASCVMPGDIFWYSISDKPEHKYANSWELTNTQQGDWICINTLRANTLVREAIEQNLINKLFGYSKICVEVKYGSANSRIGLLLQAENLINCYIEVKSVTLL